MQIKTKHHLTMLVMAGISIAAFPANAVTTTAGDLLFGFRLTTGGNDLIVRANSTGTGGNSTVYRDASAAIPSVMDLSAELVAAFGNDWNTNADLRWGVVGVRSNSAGSAGSVGNNGVPSASPFVGIAQSASTPGVKSSTAPDLSFAESQRVDVANAIVGLRTTFTSLADNGASSLAAATIAASNASSWTTKQSTTFNVGSGTEVGSANGIDDTGLDLYWILNQNDGATDNGSAVSSTPGIGVYQGSFQLSNAGMLSFTPGSAAAIPEPSRTLFAGMGLVALLFRRRRA